LCHYSIFSLEKESDIVPERHEIAFEGCEHIVLWEKGHPDDREIDEKRSDDVQIGKE
jgi:hypothetical protein